jgi:tRNA (guanine37-N1)-methyltransferase
MESGATKVAEDGTSCSASAETTRSSSSAKRRFFFSSLPVPFPADPSSVRYSVEEFPDAQLFETEETYPALSVPIQRTAELRKKLAASLLRSDDKKKSKRRKNVFPDPHRPDARRILVLQKEEKTEEGRPEIASLLSDEDVHWLEGGFTMTQTYGDLTVEQILRKLLPLQGEEEEVPVSFQTIGKVAQVNLLNHEKLLPFQYWIGKVILDVHSPTIQTVVGKLDTVESEFRVCPVTVLAGGKEPNWSIQTVNEEGCSFQLDYQTVYWNSRLSGEHKRLVELIQNDAADRDVTVVDLMAGVGPFAVPLTAPSRRNRKGGKKITVYANDLNPESYKYLCINAKRNHCKDLHCYNQDARAFVRTVQELLIEQCGGDAAAAGIDYVIMNLPASAPEFLDSFRGWKLDRLPVVHVHCFAPKTASDQEAISRCAAALGVDELDSRDCKVHMVRDVSPQKNMLCVSFRLPAAVKDRRPIQLLENETTTSPATTDQSATRTKIDEGSAAEPMFKRARTTTSDHKI